MDSEIIDISSLNFGDHNSSLKSSNFGSGIELLMNDKKKEGGRPSSDIDIHDLNNLENDTHFSIIRYFGNVDYDFMLITYINSFVNVGLMALSLSASSLLTLRIIIFHETI